MNRHDLGAQTPRPEARLLAAFAAALTTCLDLYYTGQTPVAEAARYLLGVGGKRIRPLLCLMSAEALGGTLEESLPAALAVEFVHTYSLAHDDLPCMDDDDLRRGKPTAHKIYGEATALLAGDALLTDAFALLSKGDEHSPVSPATRLALVRELALAAGGDGMVLGQSLDLYWTARTGGSLTSLNEIHLRKTGYLLGASAAMGGIAAGAAVAQVDALRLFGRSLGVAFQILDDLLDDGSGTGKSAGKDKQVGKLTYLALMGRPEAHVVAGELTTAALAALQAVAADAGKTSELAAFAARLLHRTS